MVVILFFILLFIGILVFHIYKKIKKCRKLLVVIEKKNDDAFTQDQFKNYLFERLYILTNNPVEGTSITTAQWTKLGDIIFNPTENRGKLGDDTGYEVSWDASSKTFIVYSNSGVAGYWITDSQPSNFNVLFGSGSKIDFGNGIPTPPFTRELTTISSQTVYDLSNDNIEGPTSNKNIYIMFSDK